VPKSMARSFENQPIRGSSNIDVSFQSNALTTLNNFKRYINKNSAYPNEAPRSPAENRTGDSGEGE
jgi:hypothetical protein